MNIGFRSKTEELKDERENLKEKKGDLMSPSNTVANQKMIKLALFLQLLLNEQMLLYQIQRYQLRSYDQFQQKPF